MNKYYEDAKRGDIYPAENLLPGDIYDDETIGFESFESEIISNFNSDKYLECLSPEAWDESESVDLRVLLLDFIENGSKETSDEIGRIMCASALEHLGKY
jgi:hypothetical protein